MANVLFLTQVLPYPLNSGAKIRAYYVLRQLARRHAVTLVSFVRDDDAPEAVAHLRTLCASVHTVPMRRSPLRDAWAMVKAGLTRHSIIILRDEVAGMTRLLRRLVRTTPFDLVHADQTSMVQYALKARRLSAPGPRRPRLVLDAHNALYRIPERMAAVQHNPLKRWAYHREARVLRRYEAEAYRRFDHVVFVTEVDRQELLPVASRQAPASAPQPLPQVKHGGVSPAKRGEETDNWQLTTSVIPICVDPTAQPLIARAPHPSTIVHVGTMFWPPNVEGVLWFAREVFPLVLAQVPGTRFVIVGKNPPPAIAELAAAEPNILVTGYVPDPAPYLAEAAVSIVPLHAGGGMRVKIVDAWCWGIPLASTTVGAEGIDVRDGENILIADEPQALAGAIARVLRDPAFGERMRANGRAWVEAQYDWRRIYPAWDAVYDRLLTQARQDAKAAAR